MSCPDAIVLGAGIAGATAARSLAERGLRVTVLEAQQPGHGASGNPLALIYPKLIKAHQLDDSLQAQGYLHVLARLKAPEFSSSFRQTGVLWLDTPQHPAQLAADHPWLGHQALPLTGPEAEHRTGLTGLGPGILLPQAGVVSPQRLLSALLSHALIAVETGVEAIHWARVSGQWQVHTTQGPVWQADTLVLAQAGAVLGGSLRLALPLRPVRGQIARIPGPHALTMGLVYGGYLAPDDAGGLCVGATFQPGRHDVSPTRDDQVTLATQLQQQLPDLWSRLPPVDVWQARAAIRWQTPDYLPLVGPLPDRAALARFCQDTPWSRHPHYPARDTRQRLWVSAGHGARGFTQAWLAAEMLAAQITGQTSAADERWAELLRPDRFWLRAWRRGEVLSSSVR